MIHTDYVFELTPDHPGYAVAKGNVAAFFADNDDRFLPPYRNRTFQREGRFYSGIGGFVDFYAEDPKRHLLVYECGSRVRGLCGYRVERDEKASQHCDISRIVLGAVLIERSGGTPVVRAILQKFEEQIDRMVDDGVKFSSIRSKTWEGNDRSNALQQKIGMKVTGVIDEDPAYPGINRTTIMREGDFQTVMDRLRAITRIRLMKLLPPQVESPLTDNKAASGPRITV